MNVHTHPALAGFDDMQHRQRQRAPAVMSAGDLAELTREEHRAKFKHTKLCSFYQKGQCTRTFDACAFLHTDDPDVIAKLGGVPANAPNPHNRPANADPHVNPRVNSLTGRPRPRFPPGSRIMGIGVPKRSKLGDENSQEVEMKRTVCRFYSSGMCEYGKDCRFLHIVPEPADRVLASPKSAKLDTLCRNYPGCAYGDRCDFKHVEVNGIRPADSPFSTASALPPSVSARASPAVVSRPLAAEPTPVAPPLSLGERLGLLGERAGSSVVGERTNRKELIRTASFGELPRRETGLLEERRPSLLDERRSSLLDERRSSLLSEAGRSLLSESRQSLLSDRGPLTRGASFNGTDTAPSPLRSSSLNLVADRPDRPNSAFGSLLGLGFNLERAHASQPHTRTHTPIPRAPSPSPTHIGIPPSRIVPHPATVLAPSANGTTNTAPGSGANTPLIRTLPPPTDGLSGTGWRVASPLPPHISNEIIASVPGSPLALTPGSPLANAFGDGFFAGTGTSAPERKTSGLGLGLGLTGLPTEKDFESDGEGDVLPTMSYEDFADGFTTDHEHDHDHDHEVETEPELDRGELEKPRGYKTLPCKYFNPLLGRDCPAGDECNFIHDQLLSNNSPGLSSEAKALGKESMHPLFRTRECKYWAAGRCNQGDECPFKHTYGDDVDHSLDTQSQTQDSRENPYWRTRPCKWFQQGQCLRGENCNYLHTLDTPAPVVCKFYPTPGCRNGAECPFVHTDDKAAFEDQGFEDGEGYKPSFDGSEDSGLSAELNGQHGLENGGYGNGFGNGVFSEGANGLFPEPGPGLGANGFGANGLFAGGNGLFEGGNGLYENGLFHGYTYQPQREDKVVEEEDSEDDVIFEPMRSAGGVEARSPGGLSMLLSGLALNGHAAAQAQVKAQAQVEANKAN